MKFVDLDGINRVVRYYDEFRMMVSKGQPQLVVIRGREVNIHLQDGVASMNFPSRDVLKTALQNWRSLYGTRLVVGNRTIGRVGKNLPDGI